MIDGSKEKVHKLVEVFYPQPFKTFYVNSIDGKSLSQPQGVFVSLGITTSMNILGNIMNVLDESKDFSAKIVEIGSRREEGIFLNYITSENPVQYRLGTESEDLMTREETLAELDSLAVSAEGATLEEIQALGIAVERLKTLFDKLEATGGWNDHCIQKTDLGYRIYHLNINYKKEGDIEYRIGILVNEKI